MMLPVPEKYTSVILSDGMQPTVFTWNPSVESDLIW